MDSATLFAGVVFGCGGLAAWQFGRRRQSARHMVLGLVLMGFPYVVPEGWMWTWGTGSFLTLMLFWP